MKFHDGRTAVAYRTRLRIGGRLLPFFQEKFISLFEIYRTGISICIERCKFQDSSAQEFHFKLGTST